MKIEIEISEAAVSRILRSNANIAPSLRVPVTTANRALLRELRREEMSAWETGRRCSGGYFPSVNPGMAEHRFI